MPSYYIRKSCSFQLINKWLAMRLAETTKVPSEKPAHLKNAASNLQNKESACPLYIYGNSLEQNPLRQLTVSSRNGFPFMYSLGTVIA